MRHEARERASIKARTLDVGALVKAKRPYILLLPLTRMKRGRAKTGGVPNLVLCVRLRPLRWWALVKPKSLFLFTTFTSRRDRDELAAL